MLTLRCLRERASGSRPIACRRALLVVVLAAAVSGCSPFRLINGLSPSDHYEITADLAYGELDRQTLDVYRPRDAEGSAPLVVFFYGGGWRDGEKADYQFVASSLTEAGFVVVIPDYRLFPEVVFPAFVEDGADAVAWAMQNGARFGANTDIVFLMGHSAGAHIAALLAADQRYLSAHGLDVGMLTGLIGLSGPYDFLPIESGYLLEVFPERNRDASQPINRVTSAVPPALLIHGADDDVVRPSNSRNFARRLAENGVEATLKVYEGVGHAEVAAELAPPLEFTGDTLQDTLSFLRKQGDRATVKSR